MSTAYFAINDGELDDEHADNFIRETTEAHEDDPNADWVVYINTAGGNMEAGGAIFDQIEHHSARKEGGHLITTAVRGKAYSAGGIISQAGDIRTMGKMSLLMFHEPRVSLENETLTSLKSEVAIMSEWWDGFLQEMSLRSSLSANDLSKWINGGNWYLTAPRALALGLIDRIE